MSDPSLFGHTDVTDPCYVGPYTGGGSVCSNPNSYLFWHELHPTAFGHAVLSEIAYNLIDTPSPSAAFAMFDSALSPTLPEPSTSAVMLLGFAGLSFVGYRASGRPRQSRPRDWTSDRFRDRMLFGPRGKLPFRSRAARRPGHASGLFLFYPGGERSAISRLLGHAFARPSIGAQTRDRRISMSCSLARSKGRASACLARTGVP